MKTLHLDKKCGASGIPENAKCTKGTGSGVLTAGVVAGTAVALGLAMQGSTDNKKKGPTIKTTPQLPGAPGPTGLLKAGRLSKTQRMRENTKAAVKIAEGRIGETVKAEIKRVAQIGNTMAAAGEATGMMAKTTLRELRLRTEAARRKLEPGYKKEKKKLKAAPDVFVPELNLRVSNQVKINAKR